MADGTDELVHAFTRLLSALIHEATRLSVEMAERRAARLRQAAQQGERAAREERARLAGHRAADAAVWRRTADPVWWRKATPEQMSRAWRAANTWHQVDPEAAGARQAMADRLRRRGIEVDMDRTANPGDARWLQTALALAQAEREEQAAFAAERDTDEAVLADEVLWSPDERPRETAEDRGEERRVRRLGDAAAGAAVTADEIMWAADKLPADQLAQLIGTAASDHLEADEAQIPSDVVEGDLLPADGGDSTTGAHQPGVINGHVASALTAAPQPPARDAAGPPVIEGMVVSAAATEPDTPRRRKDVDLPRMEAMLREAWPDDKAEKVLADGAWPALASSMQRLDRAGKNVGKLLQNLPIDTTTDVKVPAMLTAWTLRAAAAGPATLRRAVRTREQHLQRTTTLHQSAEQREQEAPRDDDVVARPADDVDTTSVARLLRTAFPTTTRQSLNRTVAQPDGSAGRPGTARDRAAAREQVTADRDR